MMTVMRRNAIIIIFLSCSLINKVQGAARKFQKHPTTHQSLHNTHNTHQVHKKPEKEVENDNFLSTLWKGNRNHDFIFCEECPMNLLKGLPNVVININNLNVEEPQEVNVEIGSNDVGAKITNTSLKENGTRVNDKFLQDFHNSSISPSVTNLKDGGTNKKEPLKLELNAHEEKNEKKNMSFFVHQLLSKRGADEGMSKIYRLTENLLYRTDSEVLNFENDNSSIPTVSRLPAEFLKQQDIEVDVNQTYNGNLTLSTTQMTNVTAINTHDLDTLSNTSDITSKDKSPDNLHIDNSTVQFPDNIDNNFTGIHDHSHRLNLTLDFDDFLPKFKNEDKNSQHNNIPDFKTDLGKEDMNLCKNESNNNNLYVASFMNCSQASNYIKSSCPVDSNNLTSPSDAAFAFWGAMRRVKDMFDAIEELNKVHLDKTPDGWKAQINDYQAVLKHEDVSQSMERVKNILNKGKH